MIPLFKIALLIGINGTRFKHHRMDSVVLTQLFQPY